MATSTITNKEVIAELYRLAKSNGGLLLPEMVVEAARSEDSAMHDSFEWDDSIAAQSYRIHQARNMIRVVVSYLPSDKSETAHRVFVSLLEDRNEDGGYRTMVSVMSDKDLRSQLLSVAKTEMECFERKYAQLKELAVVFAAMRRVR